MQRFIQDKRSVGRDGSMRERFSGVSELRGRCDGAVDLSRGLRGALHAMFGFVPCKTAATVREAMRFRMHALLAAQPQCNRLQCSSTHDCRKRACSLGKQSLTQLDRAAWGSGQSTTDRSRRLDERLWHNATCGCAKPCHAMQRDATQRVAMMPCHAMPCNAKQSNVTQRNATQCNTIQCNELAQ
jgi:hypothetical protein